MLGLVVSLALLAPGKADPVAVKWKFQVGDTFYATTVTLVEQTNTINELATEQRQGVTVVSRFKVLKADATATTLEQTILRWKDEAAVVDHGDKLRDATFKLILDGKGQVTKVEGLDDAVKKHVGDDEDVKLAVGDVLTAEAVKRAATDLFAVGPAEPAKVDGTWKRDQRFSLGIAGDGVFKLDNKLTAAKAGTATVAVTGEAKHQPPKKSAKAVTTVTNMKLKTDKLAGGFTFDGTAGRLKESSLEAELSATLTLSTASREFDVDLKQKRTRTITVSDKKPLDP